MMNWIWLGLIALSILCAAFTGRMGPLTIQSFESAKDAVWLALKLAGIMAFWLGVMKVAEHSGLLRSLARALRRPMRWLFPEVPPDHPAMSAMILNFGANMLGLANAATPFGIQAMGELDKLNRHKGTATDAMCLFLAINTSSLTLLATGTIGLRAAAGSRDPAGIWLPSLLASACTTVTAVLLVKWLQRLRRFRMPELPPAGSEPPPPGEGEQTAAVAEPPPAPGRAGWFGQLFGWGCVAAFVGAGVWHALRWAALAGRLEDAAAVLPHAAPLADAWLGAWLREAAGVGAFAVVSDFLSYWSVPALLGGLLTVGLLRGVRVYESLVEGAKEGFQVAVRIIPYLVAIMVAVAMFRASGAMELMKASLGVVTAALGMPAEVLPMAIIRPLSGNGAFAYMSSIFTQYGPDSLQGYMVSVLQGSCETTLYVLAVYFGAVQVTRVRHALAAGLGADLVGVIAAVALTQAFFG